jgi:superfamily II RNA helicase
MVKICNTPYPNDTPYNEYFNQYSYTLSDFQKHAIQGIVEGKHILITAHTGSGKTLPALFAITHFIKCGKKVIYTSPIKALSNQKYWEFTQKFPDLTFGLLTGDIKTNPTADVLIMTTEILMNYLFRKDNPNVVHEFEIDIETELGCVVFDEVHYINDASRGHVWEQTILMMPPHIQMIMLSATIDQPEKFGQWIEQKPKTAEVCLCSTETRVVPLTHYSFMTIGEGIFKGIKDDVLKQNIRNHTNKLIPLKSEKGIFNETNYHEVKTMLTLFENKQTYVKRKFAVNALMTFLKDREMLPAIIFVFSRKQVEVLSQEITTGLLEDDSKIPYTIANECSQVLRSKITNFKEYLELPEYISLVKLLEKGIGIHHSGMIPVLREIVELFISKKYIKLLIATESFAIGLDCPIKTAVFISLTKFDGNQMRLLAPHEYSQMSGRAGRRGIDTIGNIVHCSNLFPLPSITEYRDILCGTPQKLESKFQISYSVLFSLMTVHGGSIDVGGIQEFVEKSMSFREIQSSLGGIQKNMDVLEEKFRKKQEFLKILKTPEEILVQYVLSKKGLEMASHKKRKEITKELSKYVDEHKNLEKDLIVWMEKEDIGVSLNKERTYLRETQNRVEQQIQNIISIMQTYGYVQRADTILHLTKLGELACHFSEVHPLLMSNVVYPECSGLTPQQIVGLLSCFTKVKIENTAEETEVKEPALKKIIEKVKQMMDHLERDELAVGLFTYSDNNEIIYHLVDVMMEWCDCLDENACKYFIQTSLVEKGISIGDFTKAVLKIETIVQEIEKTCITESSVDLLHKCSLIHPIILKYITTSQSLYI